MNLNEFEKRQSNVLIIFHTNRLDFLGIALKFLQSIVGIFLYSISVTTSVHPIGVVISDSRNILHRIISLQKKRKLETNPIPTCLASVV